MKLNRILMIFSISILMLLSFGCGKKDENVKEEKESSKYQIELNGVNVTPGSKFNDKDFSNYEYSEIQSCAFEGLDKVYTFDSYEITVSNINNSDTVYSVYFLDDTVSTSDGIKISDSIEDVKKVYGDNYNDELNELVYKEGNVLLSFIYNEETVVSISYTLVTD